MQETNHPATKIEILKQLITEFNSLKSAYEGQKENSLAVKLRDLIKFELTKRSTMKNTEKTNCSSKASKHKRSQS